MDREQTRATVAAVCGSGGEAGANTFLYGAGGVGKTSLAKAVCAHGRVQRQFRSRIYFVTIGRDVRSRVALAAKVAEVTRFITGDTTEFGDPVLAGHHLGRLLDQRPRTLLVLDDVWEAEQLAPFLLGGRQCVRLVTTRDAAVIPANANRVHVDYVSTVQARALLLRDLPPLPDNLVEELLSATGRWALLLHLTNRLIHEQTAHGADPKECAEWILRLLRDQGPAAVDHGLAAVSDLNDPQQRNRAVVASIEAATTLLPLGSANRLAELAIFVEDENIPMALAATLWRASSGLTEEQTHALCQDMQRVSLIAVHMQDDGIINLHDVIRDYFRSLLTPDDLARLNCLLVDAVAANLPTENPLAPDMPDPERAWWQLQDDYLTDHLIHHLLSAGRGAVAEAVAGDLRWVEARLLKRGPTAPLQDLLTANTQHTRSLARSLAQASHFLSPTDPPQALISILHSSLSTHSAGNH
ncbi:NB-ARC domain-containing protein [Streptomyces sp. NPDC001492]